METIMKKIYLTVLIFCALLFSVHAQENKSINKEYNVRDITAYAAFVNQLAIENGFSTFLWDCSTHMDRNNMTVKFPEYIDAIINSYPVSNEKGNKGNDSVFEEESAFTAVKNFRAGWNLGNTLDATSFNEAKLNEPGWIIKYGKKDSSGKLIPAAWEKSWGQPETNQQIADFIIDAGFNAIRIPVTWAEHLDKNNNVDSAWMKRVKETVDYFYNRGVYCIINVHHDGGADGWIKASDKYYERYNERFSKLWSQIAMTFKDYDERLLFESMNEVLDENKNWDRTTDAALNVINKWNQLFVNSVRKTGGNNSKRNLIVMTYCGGGNEQLLSKFKIPEDKVSNHIILEVHNYNPTSFTWTDVTWAKMTAKWNPENHGNLLKKEFEVYKKYSDQLNVPIIIGEYNATPKKYADYDK